MCLTSYRTTHGQGIDDQAFVFFLKVLESTLHFKTLAFVCLYTFYWHFESFVHIFVPKQLSTLSRLLVSVMKVLVRYFVSNGKTPL